MATSTAAAGLLPSVIHVVPSIQLALAPAFLLTAVHSFLGVLAGRLARVIDRSRALSGSVLESHGGEHDRAVEELKVLDRRIAILNRTILMAVLCAGLLCVVIIALFIGAVLDSAVDRLVAALFILSMVALLAAFVQFIREIGLAARVIRVRQEILMHEDEEQQQQQAAVQRRSAGQD